MVVSIFGRVAIMSLQLEETKRRFEDISKSKKNTTENWINGICLIEHLKIPVKIYPL